MNAEKLAQLEKLVKDKIEVAINTVFIEAHWNAGTTSGDITPDQQLKLDHLQEEIGKLIVEQTLQNL